MDKLVASCNVNNNYNDQNHNKPFAPLEQVTTSGLSRIQTDQNMEFMSGMDGSNIQAQFNYVNFPNEQHKRYQNNINQSNELLYNMNELRMEGVPNQLYYYNSMPNNQGPINHESIRRDEFDNYPGMNFLHPNMPHPNKKNFALDPLMNTSFPSENVLYKQNNFNAASQTVGLKKTNLTSQAFPPDTVLSSVENDENVIKLEAAYLNQSELIKKVPYDFIGLSYVLNNVNKENFDLSVCALQIIYDAISERFEQLILCIPINMTKTAKHKLAKTSWVTDAELMKILCGFATSLISLLKEEYENLQPDHFFEKTIDDSRYIIATTLVIQCFAVWYRIARILCILDNTKKIPKIKPQSSLIINNLNAPIPLAPVTRPVGRPKHKKLVSIGQVVDHLNLHPVIRQVTNITSHELLSNTENFLNELLSLFNIYMKHVFENGSIYETIKELNDTKDFEELARLEDKNKKVKQINIVYKLFQIYSSTIDTIQELLYIQPNNKKIPKSFSNLYNFLYSVSINENKKLHPIYEFVELRLLENLIRFVSERNLSSLDIDYVEMLRLCSFILFNFSKNLTLNLFPSIFPQVSKLFVKMFYFDKTGLVDFPCVNSTLAAVSTIVNYHLSSKLISSHDQNIMISLYDSLLYVCFGFAVIFVQFLHPSNVQKEETVLNFLNLKDYIDKVVGENDIDYKNRDEVFSELSAICKQTLSNNSNSSNLINKNVQFTNASNNKRIQMYYELSTDLIYLICSSLFELSTFDEKFLEYIDSRMWFLYFLLIVSQMRCVDDLINIKNHKKNKVLFPKVPILELSPEMLY